MTLCSYSSLSCHILLPRTDCSVYYFHWTSYNLFLIFCKMYVEEIQISCDWVIICDVTSNKLRLGDKLWCYLHCALLCACRLPARHWAPHPRLPPPPILSCSHWAAHPILPPEPSLLAPTQSYSGPGMDSLFNNLSKSQRVNPMMMGLQFTSFPWAQIQE